MYSYCLEWKALKASFGWAWASVRNKGKLNCKSAILPPSSLISHRNCFCLTCWSAVRWKANHWPKKPSRQPARSVELEPTASSHEMLQWKRGEIVSQWQQWISDLKESARLNFRRPGCTTMIWFAIEMSRSRCWTTACETWLTLRAKYCERTF